MPEGSRATISAAAAMKGGWPLAGGDCLRAGSTLIEVLVVIAVLLVLAAQMFGALLRAKGKSHATVCKSNLRQLGMGLQIYRDDSASTYPYVEWILAENPRRFSSWFDAVGSCLPGTKWGEGVFKCPAYKGVCYEGESKLDSRGALSAVHYPCGSYAYNATGRPEGIYRSVEAVSPGLGFSVLAGRAGTRPVRESDIKVPADLYAIGDAPVGLGKRGKAPTLVRGGAADYNSFASDDVPVRSSQHGVTYNMLFADSHTESVKTIILLSTNTAHRIRWNHDHVP